MSITSYSDCLCLRSIRFPNFCHQGGAPANGSIKNGSDKIPHLGEEDVLKSHLSFAWFSFCIIPSSRYGLSICPNRKACDCHYSNVVQFFHVKPLQTFHPSHIRIFQFHKCAKSPVSLPWAFFLLYLPWRLYLEWGKAATWVQLQSYSMALHSLTLLTVG